MTTMALTVAAIRKMLQDRPDEDYLTALIAAAATTTMTVNDVTKHAAGVVWEFSDGDLVLTRSVDESTSIVTIKRGHEDATAAAHASGAVILKEPRFRYNTIAQAVNLVLDADLYNEGIYYLNTHQVTSSATTDAYNAPTSSCEEFVQVYQMTSTMTEPRNVVDFTRIPDKVDTSLYANGKVFRINENMGTPGTELYYVNCKERLAIGTLSTPQERIVQMLAAAYLLEWQEPRRTSGPTDQNDQTVRPGANLPTAAYFRQLASKLMAKERSNLKIKVPRYRQFVKGV